MSRINVVLLLAVLASALYLVRTQYESRQLFGELEKANNEARRLEVEFERLQVEKRAQATPLRVEKMARQQLQMHSATPGITQYVGDPDAKASAAASEVVR
ncbi:MAG: cell division protein FtsL [Pseudomonadota bacterium]